MSGSFSGKNEPVGAEPGPACPATTSKTEALALSLVLVAAYHGIRYWGWYTFIPTEMIYRKWGPVWFAALWDLAALLAPLVLCLGAARRSGLSLGRWDRWKRVLIVVCLPVVAVAIVSPFTSNPFKHARIGTWLISPTAQELMFSGYLYGSLAVVFTGSVSRRLPIPSAVLITAGFFVLWHVPNFYAFPPRFAAFQLFYTFLGGICFLLARRWTGSILPSIASHMGANFFAWVGW